MLKIIEKKLNFFRKQCVQCGVCLASCPKNALTFRVNEPLGIYDILINQEKCTLCATCTKVCPPNFMYEDTTTKEQIENARGLYLGYAQDKKVRYESSTGGVAKTLAKILLEQRIVDAVYTLEYSENEDDIYGTWITKFESYKIIPNSIYRPIMWGKNLLDIDKEAKKVMIIGLPCQIKGAKKLLEMKRRKFEIFCVALMCRQQKNMNYTKYYSKMLNTSFDKVKYRGEGWPGVLHRLPLTSIAWGFWKLEGCNYCSDCVGADYSDVTLGDPWRILTQKQDNVGTNTIYVWNEKAEGLLKNCGAINLALGNKEKFHDSMQYGLIKRKESDKAFLLGKSKTIKQIALNKLTRLASKIYEIILMYKIVNQNKYVRKLIIMVYARYIIKIIR